MTKLCKDCGAEGFPGSTIKRPAPYPGPRCATHHRLEIKRRKQLARGREVRSRYGLTDAEFDRLMQHQGGACAGCGKMPGPRARQMAVDHDHSCCAGKTSCGRCVRGLLCYDCNSTLATYRDSSAKLRRLADYVDNPPMSRLRGEKA